MHKDIPHAQRNVMLTVLVSDFNTFTQAFYNSIIESLDLALLTCTCGHSGCLSIHGYYTRSVITPVGKVVLIICRVKCSECGHTHALLLSSMVPYSQIPAEDQRLIAEAYESGTKRSTLCSLGSGIDENNIKSVIRRYVKFWRQRLIAAGIRLESLPDLITSCFRDYSKQVMQIRSTRNKLFAPST